MWNFTRVYLLPPHAMPKRCYNWSITSNRLRQYATTTAPVKRSRKSTMAPRSQEDLIMRGYANALRPFLYSGSRSSRRVYVSPLGRNTLPVHGYPETMLNSAIHQLGDNLLPPDNPIYVTGGPSYFQTLHTYLQHVKLTRNPTPDARAELNEAKAAAEAALTDFDRMLEKAIAKYNLFPDKNEVNFKTWVKTYYRPYWNAESLMLHTSQAYNDAMLEYYGTEAEDVKRTLDTIASARQATLHEAGANMPCTALDFEYNTGGSTDFKVAGAIKAAIPFYRPLYYIQGLSSALDEWKKTYNAVKPTELKINLTKGQDFSWERYGFKEPKTSRLPAELPLLASATSVPLVDVSGGADQFKRPSRILGVDDDTAEMELKIKVYGQELFEINTGIWDVPGFRSLFPNVRKSCPEELRKPIIKAEAVLIGYGIGVDIELGKDMFKKASNLLDHARESNSAATVMGMDVSLGSDGNKGESSNVPVVKLDSARTTLSIPSRHDAMPVILAVVGREV